MVQRGPQRWPTHAYPPPGRPPEFLRASHPQRSRQHGGRSRRFRPTARRGPCGAGPQDGAAGAGPHPQTEAMGTTAAPVARLERALAHGKTPKPSEWSQFRYGAHTARIAGGASRWQRPLWKRPSNGTGHRQTGQTDANPANAGHGRARLGGSEGMSDASVDNRRSAEGPRCPADTPNNLANIADPLAERLSGC